jgi:hypothetical protein
MLQSNACHGPMPPFPRHFKEALPNGQQVILLPASKLMLLVRYRSTVFLQIVCLKFALARAVV